MSDTPAPTPEEQPVTADQADQAAATHNVVGAGGESQVQTEPHPLEGKPPPTTALLELEEGQEPAAYGSVVGVVASFEQWIGEAELTVTASQEGVPVAIFSWTWSGHESPHTTRIACDSPSWDPAKPAHMACLLTVYGSHAPLTSFGFDIGPAAQEPQ